MLIPMTKRSLELIRQRKKITTLRSLKEVYSLGFHKLSNGSKITIYRRILVLVDEENIHNQDYVAESIHDSTEHNRDVIARTEGFDSFFDLIKALKSMRHRLPKLMWLYFFELKRGRDEK